MASLMASTTINVAVPDMSRVFALGQERARWLSAGLMAAMTLTTPWMLERFGYRHTSTGAVLLLTAGGEVVLHGHSLLFLRNDGHVMTNPAIRWGANGKEVLEGILGAVVTTTIALHDLKGLGCARIRNSRSGSEYRRPRKAAASRMNARVTA